MNPYETLQVDSEASDKDIKTAYRKRAMETHPDVNDGDDEEFKSVALAYSILSDPNERAYYDRTGEQRKGKTDPESEAIAFIVGQFMELVGKTNYDSLIKLDIFKAISDNSEIALRKFEKELKQTEKEIDHYSKVLNRLVSDFCQIELNKVIAAAESKKREMQIKIEIIKLVPDICKKQKFIFDEQDEENMEDDCGFDRWVPKYIHVDYTS